MNIGPASVLLQYNSDVPVLSVITSPAPQLALRMIENGWGWVKYEPRNGSAEVIRLTPWHSTHRDSTVALDLAMSGENMLNISCVRCVLIPFKTTCMALQHSHYIKCLQLSNMDLCLRELVYWTTIWFYWNEPVKP